MGGAETVERRRGQGFNAEEWFRRFNELYNASAGSTLTELGLFYDRHRKFVEYGQLSDPKDPEYTDEEWNRVMEDLLGKLAGDLGLVQAVDHEQAGRLEWYLPGVPDRPSVLIRSASDATSSILTHELVELSRARTDLSVFLMYPDYPPPDGSSTFEAATRAWKDRLEQRLIELGPQREVLTLMISAYSFEIPAPWRGFVWKPSSASLDKVRG
jgi:hypothetical protein